MKIKQTILLTLISILLINTAAQAIISGSQSVTGTYPIDKVDPEIVKKDQGFYRKENTPIFRWDRPSLYKTIFISPIRYKARLEEFNETKVKENPEKYSKKVIDPAISSRPTVRVFMFPLAQVPQGIRFWFGEALPRLFGATKVEKGDEIKRVHLVSKESGELLCKPISNKEGNLHAMLDKEFEAYKLWAYKKNQYLKGKTEGTTAYIYEFSPKCFDVDEKVALNIDNGFVGREIHPLRVPKKVQEQLLIEFEPYFEQYPN